MLEPMTSALANLPPVVVSGGVLPPPQLLANLPMLHRFLTEVVEDWLRAVKPYQEQIDRTKGDLHAALTAFMELQRVL
ncbi:MAG: hypothetical protein AAB369_06105, partial [Chloroflexota bacterium]